MPDWLRISEFPPVGSGTAKINERKVWTEAWSNCSKRRVECSHETTYAQRRWAAIRKGKIGLCSKTSRWSCHLLDYVFSADIGKILTFLLFLIAELSTMSHSELRNSNYENFSSHTKILSIALRWSSRNEGKNSRNDAWKSPSLRFSHRVDVAGCKMFAEYDLEIRINITILITFLNVCQVLLR